MIAYYINIEILGTELLIDEILKILGNKIKIEYIIHPNDKKPKRDEKYGFGCISYFCYHHLYKKNCYFYHRPFR